MLFDPKPYADGIRARNEAETLETAQRAKRALAEAERLAEVIAGRDRRVQRVYLFGSLAIGMPRNPKFDIDLAIDGGDVYEAMASVEGSEYHVDVAKLSGLPPHARESILARGRLLFERTQ